MTQPLTPQPFPIELQLTTLPGASQQTHQTLLIKIREYPLQYHHLNTLTLPPQLDPKQGLILYGKAPTWLYSYLIEKLLNWPWLACFDIKEGAVIISSRIPSLRPGQILPIVPPHPPSPAILIGGPPNSGKSVLSNTIRSTIEQQHPELEFYLHRANWDGEGNHTYETPDRALAARLKQENKYPIHKQPNAEQELAQYFHYQANATQNIRKFVNLVLVDIGGKPEPVKLPVIEQCTHCLIISRDSEQIQNWLDLCQNLTPIAIIHSVLEDKIEILKTNPHLEIVAGVWDRDKMRNPPDILIKAILNILPNTSG
ncbi:CRISPR-associated ring nuclease Crn3/Csx3 [Spirulina subsalsa]|uniref:CRISPR-associated ring nuclease Crn3/Csx3 n=1 Tax=Spirulina subsalsa TaxID=54311 RepID=UPI00031EA33E|nr:CRISPR-associated ring nuclease Crn3/Csx3 [Spirulina subsalsa]